MAHSLKLFDDHHQTIKSNRTYVRETYSSTTNQSYFPYSSALPMPTINICENFLYETKLIDDVGSATSSYINNSEHYDNAYMHTYDNPIKYFDSCHMKQSLLNISRSKDMNEHEIIINERDCSASISQSTSPILFYLENKALALYSCIISFILLLIIAIGIFLLNKFIRPIVIHTTVNNHYDLANTTNTSTTLTTTQSTTIFIMTTTSPLITSTIPPDNLPFLYPSCPSDRWGMKCENICKPCGVGICHSITGTCICPEDTYGEFCDLSKVDDQPKRGDLMN